jgi:hypothetical protein
MSEEELNEAMQYNFDYTEAMLSDLNGDSTHRLITDTEKAIKDLQQKVEQLENIRKEAIEYIDGHTFYYTDTPYDLLDILNKGDNKE